MIGGRSRNRVSGRWQDKSTVVEEKSRYIGMNGDMHSSFITAYQTVVAPFFLTTTPHCDKTLTWFMAPLFFTNKDKNHTFTSNLAPLLLHLSTVCPWPFLPRHSSPLSFPCPIPPQIFKYDTYSTWNYLHFLLGWDLFNFHIQLLSFVQKNPPWTHGLSSISPVSYL